MGAGYHGGFGKTKGELQKNKQLGIPINKVGDVRYNERKTKEYLLNLNHPIGCSKAKFFKDVLGYTEEDSRLFHKNIVKAIIGRKPMETQQTEYGVKHTYGTEIVGKNGNKIQAKVVVVVQKDKGRITYKIITVYPNKKEK